MSFNPYAAPAAPVEHVSGDAVAEATRREHLSHEASIKAVGFLYYLGGVGVTIVAAASLLGLKQGSDALFALLLLALGAAQLFAGWGVRALRRWGRTVGSILSFIGLAGFPVGTLINGYILYLFLSKKGRTVFSPAYQDAIAATPHIKYRTSILVWIFLALLAAVIGFAMVGSFSGK